MIHCFDDENYCKDTDLGSNAVTQSSDANQVGLTTGSDSFDTGYSLNIGMQESRKKCTVAPDLFSIELPPPSVSRFAKPKISVSLTRSQSFDFKSNSSLEQDMPVFNKEAEKKVLSASSISPSVSPNQTFNGEKKDILGPKKLSYSERRNRRKPLSLSIHPTSPYVTGSASLFGFPEARSMSASFRSQRAGSPNFLGVRQSEGSDRDAGEDEMSLAELSVTLGTVCREVVYPGTHELFPRLPSEFVISRKRLKLIDGDEGLLGSGQFGNVFEGRLYPPPKEDAPYFQSLRVNCSLAADKSSKRKPGTTTQFEPPIYQEPLNRRNRAFYHNGISAVPWVASPTAEGPECGGCKVAPCPCSSPVTSTECESMSIGIIPEGAPVAPVSMNGWMIEQLHIPSNVHSEVQDAEDESTWMSGASVHESIDDVDTPGRPARPSQLIGETDMTSPFFSEKSSTVDARRYTRTTRSSSLPWSSSFPGHRRGDRTANSPQDGRAGRSTPFSGTFCPDESSAERTLVGWDGMDDNNSTYHSALSAGFPPVPSSSSPCMPASPRRRKTQTYISNLSNHLIPGIPIDGSMGSSSDLRHSTASLSSALRGGGVHLGMDIMAQSREGSPFEERPFRIGSSPCRRAGPPPPLSSVGSPDSHSQGGVTSPIFFPRRGAGIAQKSNTRNGGVSLPSPGVVTLLSPSSSPSHKRKTGSRRESASSSTDDFDRRMSEQLPNVRPRAAFATPPRTWRGINDAEAEDGAAHPVPEEEEEHHEAAFDRQTHESREENEEGATTSAAAGDTTPSAWCMPYRTIAVKVFAKMDLDDPKRALAFQNEVLMGCKACACPYFHSEYTTGSTSPLIHWLGIAEDTTDFYLVMDIGPCGNLEKYLSSHTLTRSQYRRRAPKLMADVVLALESLQSGSEHVYDQDWFSPPPLHLEKTRADGEHFDSPLLTQETGNVFEFEADQRDENLKGVVLHRDMKPENLFFTYDGHLKLGDFGSACFLGDDARNTYGGTPAYMSPEMVRNSKAGRYSDLWAAGCILYYLLEGKPLFSGSTSFLVTRSILLFNPDTLVFSDPEEDDDPTFESGKDLIRQILQPVPTDRLGSEERGGFDALKSHPFFQSIHWESAQDDNFLRTTPSTPLQDPKDGSFSFSSPLSSSNDRFACSTPSWWSLLHPSGVVKEKPLWKSVVVVLNDLRFLQDRVLLVLSDTPRLLLVDEATKELLLSFSLTFVCDEEGNNHKSHKVSVDQKRNMFSVTVSGYNDGTGDIISETIRFRDESNGQAGMWCAQIKAATAKKKRRKKKRFCGENKNLP